MKPKIFCLLGHGGYAFSFGFAAWSRYLNDHGYDAEARTDYKLLEEFTDDVLAVRLDRSIVLAGYSLGANACAWVASELAKHGRTVGLVIGFDPTINGPPLSMYPIKANVQRCICFHQTTKLRPTSWAFGRGVYVRAETGPPIETHVFVGDHFLMQFDKGWQGIAVEAIKQVG